MQEIVINLAVCQSALNFEPLSVSNIDTSYDNEEVVPVDAMGPRQLSALVQW